MNLLPFFAAGLAGSVHCIGMCGGIAGALAALPARSAGARVVSLDDFASTDDATGAGKPLADTALAGTATSSIPRKSPDFLPRRVIPITAVPSAQRPAASFTYGPAAGVHALTRLAAYNAGRIASYVLAGAAAGSLAEGMLGGALVRSAGAQMAVQMASYWLANSVLVLTGLYLMGAAPALALLGGLEQLGRRWWARLLPLLSPLLPVRTLLQALAVGALWAWVPCGMVYSMLVTAMLSGSATTGGAIMLAFGLGTLPMLLLVGVMGVQLRRWLQQRAVRMACGLLVLGFGAIGMLRAGGWIHGSNGLQGLARLLCVGGAS